MKNQIMVGLWRLTLRLGTRIRKMHYFMGLRLGWRFHRWTWKRLYLPVFYFGFWLRQYCDFVAYNAGRAESRKQRNK